MHFIQYFNQFLPSVLFYLITLDRSISNLRDVWLGFTFILVRDNSVFHANSVDPDQTPRSAASDLGLNCLPMSLLWDF